MLYEYKQVHPRFPNPSDCKRFELDEGFELIAASDGGERMPRGIVLWGRRPIDESGQPVPPDGPTLEYKTLFVPFNNYNSSQASVPGVMQKEQADGFEVVSCVDTGLYPPIGLTIFFRREKFQA